jgi:hypothetical protein
VRQAVDHFFMLDDERGALQSRLLNGFPLTKWVNEVKPNT